MKTSAHTDRIRKFPPLNWLRTFEVSAKHLNFTLAAHELNLTQAAVSQHIKGLEAQLGAPLFKRLPKSIALTEYGKAYIPIVHDSIEKLMIATDEIFGEKQQKTLKIRTSLVFFTSWLAPKLEEFRQLHPDILLKFTSNIWSDDFQKKIDDSDIEIRYGKGLWPGYTTSRLTTDLLIPVCSPLYFKQYPRPYSPSTISQCTLLHVSGYSEGWGHWLKKVGCEHLSAANNIQLDTTIMALTLAEQNQGIALGRTSLIENLVNSGRLITPFEEEIATDEAFYFLRPDKAYHHPSSDVFKQWILKRARG